MRVLVTGGAGFVGSHVVDRLVDDGHEVTIWDDFSTGRAANLNPAAKVHHRSILDSLASMVADQEPQDAIVHCAAKADISQNWMSFPGRHELLATNIEGTVRMLEYATWQLSLQAFVFVSTAAVYGSGGGGQLFNVNSPTRAESPYAASKIAGEALVQAYGHRHGWRTPILRLVSCVGERYRHGHIADFVRQAREDGTVHALDNGRQRKSFVHVRDAASRIVTAMTGRNAVENIAAGAWSCRDTAAVMQLDRPVRFVWSAEEKGWTGDPVELRVEPSFVEYTPVSEGVDAALSSLGWS